jgi:hypothetical protein
MHLRTVQMEASVPEIMDNPLLHMETQKQTYLMPRVGFESTFPSVYVAKIFHAYATSEL